MQNLFLKTDYSKFNENLINYFKELNNMADKNKLEISFIVIQPYWIYSVNKKTNYLSRKY